ncbi:MAG: hypothetical protein HRK26_05455 [Rickettsiaceae bacterium H1]|nr:hypothetical protein [Rickettsiaceae bacterium H1]
MKKIFAIVFGVFLSISMPLYSNNFATGIWEFIYGLLYLNIGTTSCKEIVDKSGVEGKNAFLSQINQLINTANNLAGKETVDKAAVEKYAGDLYGYCQSHPEELFVKALAVVSRPMFTDMKKE